MEGTPPSPPLPTSILPVEPITHGDKHNFLARPEFLVGSYRFFLSIVCKRRAAAFSISA